MFTSEVIEQATSLLDFLLLLPRHCEERKRRSNPEPRPENMMNDDGILVRANIRLLTTAESGRTTPIRGDYRPNHNFFGPGDRKMAIGSIDLPDGSELHPGESIELPIRFWNMRSLDVQIYPGREWRIQEGEKLVGIGTVLEVLPDPKSPA